MNQSYSKFLSAKLYMIEQISLKGMLNGDKQMKKIHDICLEDYNKFIHRIENLCLRNEK